MTPIRAAAGVFALLALCTAAAAGDPPRAIGAFTLGQPIEEMDGSVQMETALPIRYMEVLEEVEIRPAPAYRSGLIAYGTCASPGGVVRIKLKYADGSRGFYEKLLERFTERFGKPTEYAGDPFHVVIDWKWSFTSADGRRTTLHLSHNSLDREEKFGNAVKMTLVDAIEDEIDCYRKRHPDVRSREAEPSGEAGTPWEALIPR